jgi:bifunctional DNase/RNase
MIEVTIHTIRVRLTASQDRLIVLQEVGQERYLPIYIGFYEAEAISLELRGKVPQRPLTHDLLYNCIRELGGRLEYVLINEIKNKTFHALLHIVQNGREVDIDARSSDSIALAVRAQVPIYAEEAVLEEAGIWPSAEIEENREQLAVFRQFVDTLNLDDLGEPG